jgi:hypothetical protein
MFKAMSAAVRPEDEEDDVDVPVEVVKVGRQRGRAAARLTVRRSAPTDRRGLAAGRPTRGSMSDTNRTFRVFIPPHPTHASDKAAEAHSCETRAVPPTCRDR